MFQTPEDYACGAEREKSSDFELSSFQSLKILGGLSGGPDGAPLNSSFSHTSSTATATASKSLVDNHRFDFKRGKPGPVCTAFLTVTLTTAD